MGEWLLAACGVPCSSLAPLPFCTKIRGGRVEGGGTGMVGSFSSAGFGRGTDGGEGNVLGERLVLSHACGGTCIVTSVSGLPLPLDPFSLGQEEDLGQFGQREQVELAEPGQ